MYQNDKTEFRLVRNFSEVFSDTFAFFRKSYKVLLKAQLLVLGPLLVIMSISLGAINMVTATGTITAIPYLSQELSYIVMALGYVIFLVVSLVAFTVLQLTVYEYIDLYRTTGHDGITIQLIFQSMKKKFFRILWTNLGIGVLLGLFFSIVIGTIVGITYAAGNTAAFIFAPIAMLLVFIGIIYFMVVFSLLVPIRVYEDAGFFPAIGRCFVLITGSWWLTFGILFVIWIILAVIGLGLALPHLFLTVVIMMHNTFNIADPSFLRIFFVITNMFQMLIYFLYSIPMIAIGFQYFSCVEKKEGKGLLEKINAIGKDQ